AAAAPKLGHQVHVGADITLEAAEPFRRAQPEELRRVDGTEHLVGNAPLALYFGSFGAQKRHQCSRLGGHFFPPPLLTGGRVFRSRRRDSEIALFESAPIGLHAALPLSLSLFALLIGWALGSVSCQHCAQQCIFGS